MPPLFTCFNGTKLFNVLNPGTPRHDTLSTNLHDLIGKSTSTSDELDSLKQEYYGMITRNDEATMRYTNVIADLTVGQG